MGRYGEWDFQDGRNQWVMVSVPVSDQCDHLCITYILEPIDPGPVPYPWSELRSHSVWIYCNRVPRNQSAQPSFFVSLVLAHTEQASGSYYGAVNPWQLK